MFSTYIHYPNIHALRVDKTYGLAIPFATGVYAGLRRDEMLLGIYSFLRTNIIATSKCK